MATGDAKPPESSGATGLLSIMGLACLALAVWMGWEFYSATISLTWPTTEGVVRTSKLVEWQKVSSGARQYQMEVTYEYTVDGKTYTNDVFNSRGNYITDEEAAVYKQKYAEGAKVPVAYSPYAPGHSMLVVGVTWHAWGKLALVIVGLLGAGGCFFVVYKDLADARRARNSS